MLLHHALEQQAVLLMRLGHFATIVFAEKHGVGGFAEIVEMAAHINFFARVLIADGHVDGAPLAVSRLGGDIAREECGLRQGGVVVGLVALVAGLRPPHKMVDCTLRTVGVVYLDDIP